MRTTELYASAGRVNCPQRGDTDIDHCFTCGHLRDYEATADGAIIRCSGRPAPAAVLHTSAGYLGVPPF